MHVVIRARNIFIKSWNVYHPSPNLTNVIEFIDVVEFNSLTGCHCPLGVSNTVFVNVLLMNLTSLQTSPHQKNLMSSSDQT